MEELQEEPEHRIVQAGGGAVLQALFQGEFQLFYDAQMDRFMMLRIRW